LRRKHSLPCCISFTGCLCSVGALAPVGHSWAEPQSTKFYPSLSPVRESQEEGRPGSAESFKQPTKLTQRKVPLAPKHTNRLELAEFPETLGVASSSREVALSLRIVLVGFAVCRTMHIWAFLYQVCLPSISRTPVAF